mmetsp:Transcript_21626/g.40765  ORF Transcript_21626/g.40765 Transcript_21626/m.40765 type:complete len:297 (-) Transcript_21626:468-1358(-)
MTNSHEAARHPRRHGALLLHHHIRIALRLRRQLTYELPLLPIIVLTQSRIDHPWQLPHLGRTGVPRPRGRISLLADHEGERAGGRYAEVVHRLGREEFANGGTEDGASVGSAAEGGLAGSLELEFVAGCRVGVEGVIVVVVVVAIANSRRPGLTRMRNDNLPHRNGTSIAISISGPVRTIIGIPPPHNGKSIRRGPRLNVFLGLHSRIILIHGILLHNILEGTIHIPAKVLDERFAIRFLLSKSQFAQHVRRVNYQLRILQWSGSYADVMTVEYRPAGTSSGLSETSFVIFGIFGI